MVFRFLRALLNDERFIQQLSESAPIRALAKTIVRGGKTLEERVEKMAVSSQIDRFTKTFKEEYQKSLKK
ncbi:hypothetical protein KIN20_018404 [Parelaphostrongylus tenuis]|uniref:Uncharacterized protein n=1 Tax=Parelaphostrongylus tenuis TaxID=148309 RepID=A0AAD5MJW7_PARTN|nr:hypothetical protein KIN20_018404 [Parelaphostrongylus tenuis]